MPASPPKCEHCPLRGNDAACPTITFEHGKFCDQVNPAHASHSPGVARSIMMIARGESQRVPTPSVPGSPADRQPPQTLAYPSFGQQVANAAGAVVEFVTSGLALISDADAERRLSICRACPDFDAGPERCRQCGCNMVAKVRGAAFSCPIKKW